jgi:hypothetical protein
MCNHSAYLGMHARLYDLSMPMLSTPGAALILEVGHGNLTKQASGIHLTFGVHWPAKEYLTESGKVRVEEVCACYRVGSDYAKAVGGAGTANGLAICVEGVGLSSQCHGPL